MRSKWLIGALIVSIVVNLLLTGFIVGRKSGDSGFGGGIGPTPIMPPLKFLEADRQREVTEDLQTRRELRPILRKLHRAQKDIHAAFVAEPFDEAALSEALAEFRGRLEESQALSHKKLVIVAARLTPDERRRLTLALDRPRGPPDKRPPRREPY